MKEQPTVQTDTEKWLRESIFNQEDFISKLAVRTLDDKIPAEDLIANEYALRFELGKLSAYNEMLGRIT